MFGMGQGMCFLQYCLAPHEDGTNHKNLLEVFFLKLFSCDTLIDISKEKKCKMGAMFFQKNSSNEVNRYHVLLMLCHGNIFFWADDSNSRCKNDFSLELAN